MCHHGSIIAACIHHKLNYCLVSANIICECVFGGLVSLDFSAVNLKPRKYMFSSLALMAGEWLSAVKKKEP